MSDLLVPGDERADGVLDDAALLAALLAVEEAWSTVLVGLGLAPPAAATGGRLPELLGADDAAALSRAAEGSGTVVVPLVALLRERLAARGHEEAARWLHRGLTSQDVLDTALVLCLRAGSGRVLADLDRQVRRLVDLARTHRDSLQSARTLTQHAVPTTFGAAAAGWLHAVLDARERLARATAALPAQVGGAAGTLSALAELAGGGRAGAAAALDAAQRLAGALDLPAGAPWHVRRGPLTAVADALVGCTDAWGPVAGAVLVLGRPEVGELREGSPGGSSTMPHKANPVLSALVRRAALSAPGHAALLHTAAGASEDGRAAGAWHAEWPALRALARTAVVAGSQTTDLLEHLVVDADRMRTNARAAAGDLLAEQRAVRALRGPAPAPAPGPGPDAALAGYLGVAGHLVDDAVARAGAPRWARP